MSLLRLLSAGLLLLATLAGPVHAQKAEGELFVRQEGDDVRAAVRIRIAPGWHLYHEELGPADAIGLPSKVQLSGADVEWSKARFPAPLKLDQPFGKDNKPTWIWGHEGTIVLYAHGRAASGAKLDELEAKVSGLTCEDNGSCVPYGETLASAGRGPDELFAAFPADLAAPAASAPAPAKSANALGSQFGNEFTATRHARAKLFVRAEGADARAAIEVRVQPGWHLYHDELGPPNAVGLPTVVKFSGAEVAWSKARFPTPVKHDQPVGKDNKPTWIWGHEGTLVIYARGRVASGAKLDELEAELTGLTCQDDGSCVKYSQTIENSGAGPDALFAAFPTDLEVGAGAASDPVGGAAVDPVVPIASGAIDWDAVQFAEYKPRTEIEQRSLALWLFFAFIAGVLLNVMPCVLPVVSIKILSFVQQAGEHRSRILALGVAFAAGILTVFLVLAGLAAFANQSWGEQFQNDTFKIVMIAIVFAFSLSLFDVYEIGVPSKVGELASVRREGIADAFFKGVMATALATPCSGPFLGSTLTWALSQDKLTIFAIFTAVGLGMAAPYVVLTANPALLKYVPRPGAWMETFKHLMGFLLLFTVIFLMMSLRQDLLLYTIAFLIFVAFACWIWGRYATFERTGVQRSGILVAALVVALLGARFTFVDFRSFLSGEGTELAWQPFDPVKLAQYHREGRPVMIDFTADWCFNCKTNEKVVYESSGIVDLLARKDVIAMKADLSHDTPETHAIERLRDKLGASSIPFMAIFPGDDWQRPYTFKDIVTRSEVREALDALPAPRQEQASR